MKRIYVSPAVCVEKAVVTADIIAASGVNSGFGGIGYGGVDSNGEQNPSVKEHAWDDIWN